MSAVTINIWHVFIAKKGSAERELRKGKGKEGYCQGRRKVWGLGGGLIKEKGLILFWLILEGGEVSSALLVSDGPDCLMMQTTKQMFFQPS